jgi:hypothetical protein
VSSQADLFALIDMKQAQQIWSGVQMCRAPTATIQDEPTVATRIKLVVAAHS